jgi:hypothetical protein
MQLQDQPRKENKVEVTVAVQPVALHPVINRRQINKLQFCFSTNSGRTE